MVSNHAAAKFWSGLIDEVLADYPFPTVISLCAATSGCLSPDDLRPDRILARDMAALAGKDLQQAYRETLAVLEMTGPPLPTTLRLTRSGEPRPFLTAMLDLPDAETMPFLVAWLLEWLDVPPERWNDAMVAGAFVAEDLFRHRRYEVHCQLACKHLSEGLYAREATLQVNSH